MINVKKVPIGGEVRPIHFGFAALAEWCDLTGYGLNDLSKLGNNMSLSSTISLMFCGLKHGARKEKKDCNFSAQDVADWVDEEGIEIITEIMEIFTESMAKVGGEKKKKETQKKK